jgi:hypothetical protein
MYGSEDIQCHLTIKIPIMREVDRLVLPAPQALLNLIPSVLKDVSYVN